MLREVVFAAKLARDSLRCRSVGVSYLGGARGAKAVVVRTLTDSVVNDANVRSGGNVRSGSNAAYLGSVVEPSVRTSRRERVNHDRTVSVD